MKQLRLAVNARAAERIRRNYPWVFRSDVTNAKELGDFPPGSIVQITDPQNRVIATGYAHPQAQLMGRILSSEEPAINSAFFIKKFQTAQAWRQQCFAEPYYRLIYSESDGLPGLIVDRFGDTLSVQVNTAGMEALQDIWLPALQQITGAKNIILKNDSTGRALEGLPQTIEVVQGYLPEDGFVELRENATRFYADLRTGQKTGWFYDQRPHRAWVASHVKGKSVLDVFCHTGAFGITAGRAGARQLHFVDASADAIALTKKNAELNGLSNIETTVGKAFDVLATLPEHGFDIVCVDPPAFVKVRKDMVTGLKGYEKLARLAAPLVKPGGVLFYASCSSHPSEQELLQAILLGTGKAGRQASLVYIGTAGQDHPMHPMLPETRYLKAFGFRVV